MAADRAASGTKPGNDTFRSATAVIVWWVWLLFAVANLIDLAIEGRDHLALMAAAILVMVTGVAYVTGQRPRVVVGEDAVTIKNPVRDHVIPWPNVIRAELSDLLRIRVSDVTRERAISAWAVHYSRRKKFTSQAKSRRAEMREARGSRGILGASMSRSMGGPMGGGFGGTGLRTAGQAQRPDASSAEAEAERAMRLINDRADAIADEADSAGEAATTDAHLVSPSAVPVRSTWNWPAIAALVIPALILTIIALI